MAEYPILPANTAMLFFDTLNVYWSPIADLGFLPAVALG